MRAIVIWKSKTGVRNNIIGNSQIRAMIAGQPAFILW